MKVGLLTSGGDCQGLNAALRGVAKTMYRSIPNLELYGIQDGYRGLIEGVYRKMEPQEFAGIISRGGTILGTSRQPFKKMREVTDEQPEDRLSMMLDNIKKDHFDAIVILGGNGTHKTAHLLSENGVNVVTMPKTIDNDVYGTDLSFGFDSAVNKATSVLDAINTTAASHGRIFIVELMGHKVGWVTLYAGIASGVEVLLLPEIPYDIESIVRVIEERNRTNRRFSIIAIAEGAISKEEAAIPKKERKLIVPEPSGAKLERALQARLEGQEVRTTVPGHFQRGGEPTPTDRLLCSRLGACAGMLVKNGQFGYMAALRGTEIVPVPLSEVAGKLKVIPPDCQMLEQARALGISLGE